MAGSGPGPLQPREGARDRNRDRDRGAAGGGRIVANAAEASRMLDGLLEDQQELEAFLEEEFAKRESAAAGGGLSRRQPVGLTD